MQHWSYNNIWKHSSLSINRFFEVQRLTCLLIGAIFTYGITVKSIFYILIAYVRYLAIKEPLSYIAFNHKKRTFQWFTFCSIATLLSMFPYFYGYNSYTDVPRYCTPNTASNSISHLIQLIIYVPMVFLIYFFYGLLLCVQCKYRQQQIDAILEQALDRQQKTTKLVFRLLLVYTVFNFLPLAVYVLGAVDLLSVVHMAPYISLLNEFNSIFELIVFIRMHKEFRTHLKLFLGIKNKPVPASNVAVPQNLFAHRTLMRPW